jgi:exosortase family protein XrtM
MDIRHSPTGIPYLPDGGYPPTPRPPRSGSLLGRAMLFFVAFLLMQSLWQAAAGTAIERLVIEDATVAVAAFWIGSLTPDIEVTAAGTRLLAPGGGINVLKGCEGTEVLFLLVAAFSVAGLSWRRSLAGLALGAGVVYLLNQLRILALFYAYRLDHALFNQLHGTVAPLMMVLLVGFYFFAWQRWSTADTPEPDAGATA